MVANRRMLAVFLERRRVGCRTIGNVHGKRMYNTTLFGMLIYILSATGFIRHTTAAPLARRNNGSPECNTEAEEVGCPGYILKYVCGAALSYVGCSLGVCTPQKWMCQNAQIVHRIHSTHLFEHYVVLSCNGCICTRERRRAQIKMRANRMHFAARRCLYHQSICITIG